MNLQAWWIYSLEGGWFTRTRLAGKEKKKKDMDAD
jgi:hypothetical protein